MKSLVTARKQSLRRLCFYTCLSVHRGQSTVAGTSWDQVHPLGPDKPPGQVHPRAGTPPGPGTPRTRYTPQYQVHPPVPGTPAQDQVHPLDRYTPQADTPPRTRYTPLDRYPRIGTPGQVAPRPGSPGPGTPPWDQVHPLGAMHAGRYGQQAGGTHPTGMHSCVSHNYITCLFFRKPCSKVKVI